MTSLQWAALLARAALALFAARTLPRVSIYALLSLASSELTLLLQLLPPHPVVLACEGMLFLAPAAAMTWALRARWQAVAGFSMSVLVWARLDGTAPLRAYLGVHAIVGAYLLAVLLERLTRRGRLSRSDLFLGGLTAISLSGAAVAIWDGDWGLVAVANLGVYALLCFISLCPEQGQEPTELPPES